MVLGCLWGIYRASTLLEVFYFVAFVIDNYAVFCLHGMKIRIAFLIVACWLANNVLVGSIGGALLEITLINANCLTMLRRLSRYSQKT